MSLCRLLIISSLFFSHFLLAIDAVHLENINFISSYDHSLSYLAVRDQRLGYSIAVPGVSPFNAKAVASQIAHSFEACDSLKFHHLKRSALSGLARIQLDYAEFDNFVELLAIIAAKEIVNLRDLQESIKIDETQLKAMAHLSQHSYEQWPVKPRGGFIPYRRFSKEGLSADAFTSPDGSSVIVAFRGAMLSRGASSSGEAVDDNLHAIISISMQNTFDSLAKVSLLTTPIATVSSILGGFLDAVSYIVRPNTLAFVGSKVGFGLGIAAPAAIVIGSHHLKGQRLLASYENDALDFVGQILDAFDGKRIFVTGHSMGGYLAQFAALHFNLAGAAFNAPPIYAGRLRGLRAMYNQDFLHVHMTGDLSQHFFSRKGAFGRIVTHGSGEVSFGDMKRCHQIHHVLGHLDSCSKLDGC